MLGVLVGTADGLLEIEPGEQPRRVLEGRSVQALDYRDGIAVAAVPGQGVWVHLSPQWRQLLRVSAAGWTPLWRGDARCVRASPGGELYIGAKPAAIFSAVPGSVASEVGALRGALQAARDASGPAGATVTPRPSVVSIAFPDRGPEAGLYVGVHGSGVWCGRQGGRALAFDRFEKRSGGLVPELNELCVHPERAERLFASTASGFYRSQDGGASWVQSFAGLDRGWAAGAAVLPGAPDTLLLACGRRPPGEPSAQFALFRSADGGLTWRRAALGDEDEWDRPPLLARLGDTDDTLFAAAAGRLWGSHDRGLSWAVLAQDLPPALALAAAL